MVECTGLENRRRLIAYRGFKSHLLRHIKKPAALAAGFFVVADAILAETYYISGFFYMRGSGLDENHTAG